MQIWVPEWNHAVYKPSLGFCVFFIAWKPSAFTMQVLDYICTYYLDYVEYIDYI